MHLEVDIYFLSFEGKYQPYGLEKKFVMFDQCRVS